MVREAREETGLNELVLVRYLGIDRHDRTKYSKDGVIIRHFFLLHCNGQPPAQWRHLERFPSEGLQEPIEFELYWARWPDDVPALAGEQDALLAAIDWDSLPD